MADMTIATEQVTLEERRESLYLALATIIDGLKDSLEAHKAGKPNEFIKLESQWAERMMELENVDAHIGMQNHGTIFLNCRHEQHKFCRGKSERDMISGAYLQAPGSPYKYTERICACACHKKGKKK